MKQYSACRRAQFILQGATILVVLLLIWATWYLFPFLNRGILITITIIFLVAAAVIFFWLPFWFGSISYSVSETRITRKSGIVFRREQVMRTTALQYTTTLRTPFSKWTGLNFIPLHAYGGTLFLAFLSRDDAGEIQQFLQENVYCRTETAQTPPPHDIVEDWGDWVATPASPTGERKWRKKSRKGE